MAEAKTRQTLILPRVALGPELIPIIASEWASLLDDAPFMIPMDGTVT